MDAHHEAMGEAISSNQVASDAAIPPMAKSFPGRQSTQAIQLTQQEERETGDLGTQIYRAYVQTSKEWWMFAGMIVAEFIPIILQVATIDVKRCTKLKIGLISLL